MARWADAAIGRRAVAAVRAPELVAALSAVNERRWVPVAAIALAVWPVWQWAAVRALSDAGDAWALLAAAAALALIAREHTQTHERVGECPRGATPASCTNGAAIWPPVRWGVPIALMLAYAAAYPFVPPLVRALIGMSALAAACSSVWFGRRMNLALWGLLLLSLPLVASLNFYLGYPLRVVVGEAASILLRFTGFSTWREGTTLVWNGYRISVDAPCSGIKMLWTGAFISCALAGLYRLDATRTLLLSVSAFIVVLLANILRATSLFYLETGIVPVWNPDLGHTFIGLVTFALAAILIVCTASLVQPAKVACGAFADNAFASGGKRRDFCRLLCASRSVNRPW